MSITDLISHLKFKLLYQFNWILEHCLNDIDSTGRLVFLATQDINQRNGLHHAVDAREADLIQAFIKCLQDNVDTQCQR